MVKELAPFVLIVLGLVTAVLSLFGEDSYSKLTTLKKAVSMQQQENQSLGDKVNKLRYDVQSLREDDRALEKAARNQLGLARPNEEIFIFEKKVERSQQRSNN